jgi:hypothetical protein
MQDKMQQGDGVTINLQCGHPNVAHGEQCPLCKCYVMSPKTDLEKLLEKSLEQHS